MKVRELIDILEGYNQEMDIIVENDENNADLVIVSVDGTELDGESVLCIVVGPDAV